MSAPAAEDLVPDPTPDAAADAVADPAADPVAEEGAQDAEQVDGDGDALLDGPASQPQEPPAEPRAPELPAGQRPLFLPSATLTIMALLALTFIATMAVIGPVRHARDQQTAFARLRSDLANAVAPVSQTDDNGKLWPMRTPVGLLDIPQIDLREVVLEGTTSGVLMSGPGHRRDTPLPGQPGNSVIMGRQTAYGGPFGSLHQLRPGDVFTITTGQGKQAFRIVTVRRAGDYAPPQLAAGRSRVTLVTAAGTPWVPQGLLRVDADLVGKAQPSGPRPLTTAALPGNEQPMAGDTGVWVQIMLICQGLLLASLAITTLRYRWGTWQAWLAGVPILLALGVALSDEVAAMLPNLM